MKIILTETEIRNIVESYIRQNFLLSQKEFLKVKVTIVEAEVELVEK